MKDEQILRKAIDEAVENGWLDLNVGLLPEDYIYILDNKIHILGTFKHFISGSLFEIIFSHSFCEAIWGKDGYYYFTEGSSNFYVVHPTKKELDEADNSSWREYIKIWQYRLSQMVLEKNPLQYLEKYFQ